MALEEFTTTELQEEIQRRANKKKEKPKPIEDPGFSGLIDLCKSIIDETYNEGFDDEDNK